MNSDSFTTGNKKDKIFVELSDQTDPRQTPWGGKRTSKILMRLFDPPDQTRFPPSSVKT